jgi:hypothetical protein
MGSLANAMAKPANVPNKNGKVPPGRAVSQANKMKQKGLPQAVVDDLVSGEKTGAEFAEVLKVALRN